MPRLSVVILSLALLFWGHGAAAFDCELEPLTKDGKHTGTVVINNLDVYCGTVHFRGGGFSVHLDGKPQRFFDSNYKYRDVLNSMCDACKFRKPDNLSGN